LVISGSSIGVGQHFIGFPNGFKFFFGNFVARIEVGVILAGKATEGFFDLVPLGLGANPQQFIVIAEIVHG